MKPASENPPPAVAALHAPRLSPSLAQFSSFITRRAMQAMAAAQAASQSACPDNDLPFSTLAVWREKIQASMSAAAGPGRGGERRGGPRGGVAGAATRARLLSPLPQSDLGEPALSPDARLRMLLEQGKDVEQAGGRAREGATACKERRQPTAGGAWAGRLPSTCPLPPASLPSHTLQCWAA